MSSAPAGLGEGWRNRRGAHIGGINDDQNVFQDCAFGVFVRRRPRSGLDRRRAGAKHHEAVRRRLEGRQGEQHHQRHEMAGVPEAMPRAEGSRRAGPGSRRCSCPRARSARARRRRRPISRSRSPCKPLARRALANSLQRGKPRPAAPATRWSGSTPRASPTPTTIQAHAGTERPSRAPICARLMLALPATMRRRAGRSRRSSSLKRTSSRGYSTSRAVGAARLVCVRVARRRGKRG